MIPIKEIQTHNWVSITDDHRYFDKNRTEYRSVSSVIKTLTVPFDANGVSLRMATAFLRGKGTPDEIKKVQQQILQDWAAKRDTSTFHGNTIHDDLENIVKYGVIKDEKTKEIWHEIKNNIIGPCERIFSEIIFYDKEYLIAGTCDLPVLRQKGRTETVLDIFDYKTNLINGIEFSSTKIKNNGDIKHYKRYLIHPFSHLEDCSYTKYSFQVSIYAYMAEKMYGVKIGKLGIIYISPDYKVSYYPVIYLRNDVELLLQNIKNLKELPDQIPFPEKNPIFDPKNVTNVW